jgi:hypothetical protein
MQLSTKRSKSWRIIAKFRKQRSAASLTLGLIAASLYSWKNSGAKEECCLDAVETQCYREVIDVLGSFVGVYPVNDEELQHRENSVCLESIQGKVLSKYERDGANIRWTDSNGIDTWRLEYDSQGKVTKHRGYRSNGSLAEIRQYSANFSVLDRFDRLGQPIRSKPDQASQEITRWMYLRDTQGRIIREEYFADEFGNRTTNEIGAYGRAFVLAENGVQVEETYIDQHGELTSDRFGSTLARNIYNSQGDQIAIEQHGALMGNKDLKIWTLTQEFDHFGNVMRGVLTVNKHNHSKSLVWCQDVRIRRNTHGRETSRSCFHNNEPSEFPNSNCHSTSYEYDSRGNNTRADCRNEKGQLTNEVNGIAYNLAWYNWQNQIVQFLTFDADSQRKAGKPFTNLINSRNANSYRVENIYDDEGDLVRINYFDINNDPARPTASHPSSIVYEYNKGLKISEAYFGREGEPVNIAHVHKKVLQYDELGNESLVATFDQENKPAVVKGSSRVEREWNQNRQEVRTCAVSSKDLLGKQTFMLCEDREFD